MNRALPQPAHCACLRFGSQRGQALVEIALVIVFLMLLLVGTVEFGRAWMVVNMITHALRDGARSAAVVPSSNRTSGIINASAITAIQDQVRNEIQTVMDTKTLTLPATVNQGTSGGIPIVTVGISGTVPYIFKIWGANFSVNLSATFRDEGR
jgi:Flp pilus assembly protein TadG